MQITMADISIASFQHTITTAFAAIQMHVKIPSVSASLCSSELLSEGSMTAHDLKSDTLGLAPYTSSCQQFAIQRGPWLDSHTLFKSKPAGRHYDQTHHRLAG